MVHLERKITQYDETVAVVFSHGGNRTRRKRKLTVLDRGKEKRARYNFLSTSEKKTATYENMKFFMLAAWNDCCFEPTARFNILYKNAHNPFSLYFLFEGEGRELR